MQQIYANEPLQYRSILRAAYRTGSCDRVVYIDIAGLEVLASILRSNQTSDAVRNRRPA
jgi:hypothetical protein